MLASLIAAFASGETMRAVQRAKSAAIAYVLAGLLALCGVGFLVGAGYIWVADRYGAIEAAIAFGVGFIAVALLVLIVHAIASRSRARRASLRRSGDLTTIGAATALALLPALTRKGGIGALLTPAIAILAYAIYRENTRPPPGEDPPV